MKEMYARRLLLGDDHLLHDLLSEQTGLPRIADADLHLQ